ncbi:MAG: hypothetical protein GY719_08750 [bacterium]|nr:hypothetical protein [bacterium]
MKVEPWKRFDAFLEWAAKLTGSETIFVLDSEGLVLVSRTAERDLPALGAALFNLLRRLQDALDSSIEGTLTVALEGDRHLVLTDVDLAWDRYVMGLAGQRAVTRSRLSIVSEKFAEILTESDEET